MKSTAHVRLSAAGASSGCSTRFGTRGFVRRGWLSRGRNTVQALATLSAVLGLDPHTIRVRREDPLTTHKCPGTNVRKLELIQEVSDLIITRHAGEQPINPPP